MRTRTRILLALVTILALPFSAGGIVGSKHDFSTASGNHTGEICRTCHVPHDHGRDTGSVGLLWNHALPNHAYTMYSSDTLDGAIEPEPTGISKMCLGCHDGTVAIDEFDNRVGSGGSHFVPEAARVPNLPGDPGNDLSATHPISIRWTHDDAPACSNCHDMHAPGGRTFISELPFFDGRVECASCHEPHGDVPPGSPHFLRKSPVASEICFHCHGK